MIKTFDPEKRPRIFKIPILSSVLSYTMALTLLLVLVCVRIIQFVLTPFAVVLVALFLPTIRRKITEGTRRNLNKYPFKNIQTTDTWQTT